MTTYPSIEQRLAATGIIFARLEPSPELERQAPGVCEDVGPRYDIHEDWEEHGAQLAAFAERVGAREGAGYA